MAWTTTKTQMIIGNKRAVSILCVADAAESNIETGLSVIEGHTVGYQSCATGPNFVYANSNSTGAAALGTLGCSGFTSGDNLFILAYGH
jgi:hypothetical protein